MKRIKIMAKPCLNKVLKEKGMTQKELSDKTGISRSAISRFDRSSQRNDDHLFTIAYALGVRAEELFELTIIEEDNK